MSQLRWHVLSTELPTKAMSRRNNVERKVRKERRVRSQREKRWEMARWRAAALGTTTRNSVGVSVDKRAEAACRARMLIRLTGECSTWLFAAERWG